MNSNQQNTGSQSKQNQSSGALANKAQNDEMMSNLKDFGAKLEADGKDDTAKTSRKQGGKSTKAASKAGQWERGEESEQDESLEASEGSEEKGMPSFKNVSFELTKAVDLTKGYLAKDKTLPYLGKLGSEVGEQVVEYVQEWAGKNNAKIDVDVVGIQGKTTATYGGVGAAAGAGLGYMFGGKAGGVVGLIFGAALGTAASCVKVSFKMDEEASNEASAPVVQ
jgi:hypothetical protein